MKEDLKLIVDANPEPQDMRLSLGEAEYDIGRFGFTLRLREGFNSTTNQSSGLVEGELGSGLLAERNYDIKDMRALIEALTKAVDGFEEQNCHERS